MKLADAILEYVNGRKAAGVKLLSAEPVLRLFHRSVGDIEIESLVEDDISRFVRREGISESTRSSNFGALKCFLSYHERPGAPLAFRLRRGPRPGPRTPPLILTSGQVAKLLANTGRAQNALCIISPATLRMLILTLYATGAKVSEVVRLRRGDVNLRRRLVTLQHDDASRARTIVFPKDLLAPMQTHLAENPGRREALVFRDIRGNAISRAVLIGAVGRLGRLAGIKSPHRRQGLRLQDIRFTYEVHRLTQAVRSKERMEDLLPALSTYMGYSTLTRAEEFLAFVPERFRTDLEKLSPSTGWNRLPKTSPVKGTVQA